MCRAVRVAMLRSHQLFPGSWTIRKMNTVLLSAIGCQFTVSYFVNAVFQKHLNIFVTSASQLVRKIRPRVNDVYSALQNRFFTGIS